MGYKVLASCSSCGYKNFLSLGGIFDDHAEKAYWPVWCDDCGKLSATNYKSIPLKCGECGSGNVTRPENPRNTEVFGEANLSWTISCPLPTDEINRLEAERIKQIEALPKPSWKMKLWAKLTRRELQNTVTEIKRFSLESLTLHGGTYRCPQCQAMELRFMKFMRTD